MKIINDASIIECTPIVIYDGCLPTRWVLRHVPECYQQYVVHQESMKLASDNDTWEHGEYFNGRYFSSLDNANFEFQKKASY